MADPDRGLSEETNFKGTQVLEINRISLAYELTSHKDQTFINKSCFFLVISRNKLILCSFRALFWGGGGGYVWPPWIRP